MKLQIISDTHNENRKRSVALIDSNERCETGTRWSSGLSSPDLSLAETDADLIILAGDIDLGSKGVEWAAMEADIQGKDCLYIAGNHEFYHREYAQTLSEMREASVGTRVHFLENDSIVINDVRFLGCTLWTDYQIFSKASQDESMRLLGMSLNDHLLIRMMIDTDERKFSPEDALKIHVDSVKWIKEELAKPFDGKTVVITHHGPSPRCAHHRYGIDKISPGFISNLEYLMGTNVDMWIYGHTHSCADVVIKGTRVVSNQLGYPREDVSGFNEQLVLKL
jgi:predicted phosphodiesterase